MKITITHKEKEYSSEIPEKLYNQMQDKSDPFRKEAKIIARKIVLIKNQIEIKQ